MAQMHKSSHRKEHAVVIAVVVLVSASALVLTACGGDGLEDMTPPPATIIRAEGPVAQPTPRVGPPKAYPVPPQSVSPARPVPEQRYPYPVSRVGTPGPTPTPVIYPTP